VFSIYEASFHDCCSGLGALEKGLRFPNRIVLRIEEYTSILERMEGQYSLLYCLWTRDDYVYEYEQITTDNCLLDMSMVEFAIHVYMYRYNKVYADNFFAGMDI
jgi:hypothetical protein